MADKIFNWEGSIKASSDIFTNGSETGLSKQISENKVNISTNKSNISKNASNIDINVQSIKNIATAMGWHNVENQTIGINETQKTISMDLTGYSKLFCYVTGNAKDNAEISGKVIISGNTDYKEGDAKPDNTITIDLINIDGTYDLNFIKATSEDLSSITFWDIYLIP